MIVAIKIVPSKDGGYTMVSEGDRVWHKKHASMKDAISEAVELQILTPNDKQHVDMHKLLKAFRSHPRSLPGPVQK